MSQYFRLYPVSYGGTKFWLSIQFRGRHFLFIVNHRGIFLSIHFGIIFHYIQSDLFYVLQLVFCTSLHKIIAFPLCCEWCPVRSFRLLSHVVLSGEKQKFIFNLRLWLKSMLAGKSEFFDFRRLVPGGNAKKVFNQCLRLKLRWSKNRFEIDLARFNGDGLTPLGSVTKPPYAPIAHMY